MKLGSWDKGHHYLFLKTKIVSLFNQYQIIFTASKRIEDAKRFFYSAVALTQLRNGLREGEALKAVLHFLETGERIFYFLAFKHGRERPIKIHPLITLTEIKEAYAIANLFKIPFEKLKERYRKFVKDYLNTNTHTLRYAFIRYLLELGYSADQIALVTGHKKLQTVYHYEQKYEAKKILEAIED